MAKFGVSMTCIYNGYAIVDAENVQEAIDKVNNELCGENLNGFPSDVEVKIGNSTESFSFGEVTADYADEILEEEN